MNETATQAASAKPGFVKGWMKAMIGTVTGLLSGAVMMYLTPLVDKAVRPAKPIANFAVEHSGLTVTFHNRSAGNGQCRWDFGDGSPLEFVPSSQETVTHTYAKPGNYTAKLSVTNLLGEENERSVTVELLDATAAKPPVEKPQILDLYVRPPGKVGQVVYAPATFQFEATADNAQHYVWSFGDGEIQLADYQTTHTFDRPGTYNVKLLAFNGKEKVQQETSIEVQAPPAGALSVSMSVADQGTMVETRRREVVVSQGVQVNGKKGPSTVEQTISATAGFEIVGVELKHSQNQNVSKTDCKVAADRKSAKVVGQLVASAAVSQAVLNERYTVVEQRKSRASRDPIPVVSSVPPGGNAVVRLPQLPDDWTDVKREVAFELRQDERVLWRGPTLPQNVPVVVGGRTYNLAAALAGDKVQVSLASVR